LRAFAHLGPLRAAALAFARVDFRVAALHPPQPRILIVEDDQAVRSVLEHCLKRAGYRVLQADNGNDGMKVALQESPDLLVLDIRLPGLDGVAVCSRLRQLAFESPILMLTGKALVPDRVAGLDAGADDYLAKPFAAEEFLARVKALLRRQRRTSAPPAVLELGSTRIDLFHKKATRDGKPLALTKTEYAVLALLAANMGKAVSRENMLDVVWGYTRLPTTRTIDTHIWRLRKKIGDDGEAPQWIKLVQGRGYCLSLPDAPCP
jgi:two-component system, OmpR family, response regulator MprA